MEHVLLILTLVMPRDMPDVVIGIEKPSLQECWADADEFVRRGLSQAVRDLGAKAVRGSCSSDAVKIDVMEQSPW